AGLGETRAAEDVAAADDETDLHAHAGDFGDLGGDAANDGGVDAVLMATEQSLAAQLQENSPIDRRALRHTPSLWSRPGSTSEGCPPGAPQVRPCRLARAHPCARASRRTPF